MIHIKILTVGKTKESWLLEALENYFQRLRGRAVIEIDLFSESRDLEKASSKLSRPIVLDETGEAFTSPNFSNFLFKEIENQGSRLTMIIGGAEGLSRELKLKGKLISLSRMTFTHQMARLFLVEQIYRAFEIQRNSPYHK
ncbi:Ribosomal RNA large subunit methyltransferase H [Chlamydiales bacterium SCGC AB-751-O23]|jgi:23S rRNA (pseudouridine1915-N3)-methyltransferase|nr:Ribosomal RNA large subunit methyltransferase H [Chlamydiales bacterium SCGC AB-751-O23]